MKYTKDQLIEKYLESEKMNLKSCPKCQSTVVVSTEKDWTGVHCLEEACDYTLEVVQ